MTAHAEMLWNGSLGVLDNGAPRYILDVGYKRQYLASLIRDNDSAEFVLHPTLIATGG